MTARNAIVLIGGELRELPSGDTLNGGGGGGGGGSLIIQVLSVTKKDVFSTTSSTFVDVTGLSLTITPSDINNKILARAFVTCGVTAVSKLYYLRLERVDDAYIAAGDAAGSRMRVSSSGRSVTDTNSMLSDAFEVFDAPATTLPITYKVTAAIESGGTVRINATGGDLDHPIAGVRGISTLTLMEIAS